MREREREGECNNFNLGYEFSSAIVLGLGRRNSLFLLLYITMTKYDSFI